MKALKYLLVLSLLVFVACSDTEEEPEPDAQPDMMPDMQPDMTPDQTAAPDPQPDMTPDMTTAPDPQPDMTPDMEAAPDPQPDMEMPELGCEEETANPDESGQLIASFEAWLALKANSGNSYTYSRTTSSFSGFRTRTEFDVEDDVVVARRYEAFDGEGNMVESYSEEGEEVGSNNSGQQPLLVEALYASCACDVLTQSPEDNFINFSTHEEGEIAGVTRNCTFFPRNCADDCDQGVDINDLGFNE